MNQNNLPRPSGKQFYYMFSFIMDVKKVPFMTPEALDKDTNLYHALLIVASYAMGVTKIRLEDAKRYDSISPDLQHEAVERRTKDYVNLRSFLSSPAMTALKDNEYTSRPENGARSKCFHFFKNAD